ncbi:hypothetical protein LCGC14_1433560, partial [marine sediment metagenome]
MAAGLIGPLISAGGALGAGLLGRRSARGATQRSPEEAGAISAGSGFANMLGGQGGRLSSFGLPQLQSSGNFLQRILSGDRATARGATTPERGAITSQFRGARSAIQSTTRGGVRDLGLATLARDRVGALSSLVPNMRTAAAGEAGRLGLGAVQAGGQQLSGATQFFSNLLGQGQRNRFLGADLERTAGQDVGGLIFRILSGIGGSRGGSRSTLPSTAAGGSFGTGPAPVT